MRLSDEQIIDVIVDYVNDSRYKQAILIDGEWGSGKTFFVEEKLLKELKNKIPKCSVSYLSLYGLNNIDQIMNEFYTMAFKDFFDKKLGKEKAEKVEKGINFTYKVFLTGLKHFNIDSKEFPSLSEIKPIKDTVIIFDDLERCNIGVNQLLGFINNLVEHNNVKVILVANQAEIGKIGISMDLLQKYLTGSDSRIAVDKIEDVNQDTTNKKPINGEQLISGTDKLFLESIIYKKIREKLIGLTIYYQADFSSIYESIVEKYVEDEKTKKQLQNSKQIVLDIFENKQHHNIRTLIFGIMAYEKFFIILDKINFASPQYLQEHKEKVLKYTMELSIQIKSGKHTYSWNNTTSQSGLVYFGKSIFEESVFGYKFVDDYLLHRYLNSDEIKKTITSIMVEKKDIDDYYKAENTLAYNKLRCWWELEDEEISKLLSKMKDELADKKYHPRYFKDMILTLMKMESNNLDGIEYDEYIPLMRSELESYNATFERQSLEILSDDPKFLDKYNTLAQPIFDVIDKKEKESKQSLNYYPNDRESWDDNFVSKCEKNKSFYQHDYKFLVYMDPDKVIEKLKNSNVKEIYSFLDGIKAVYFFSNLNEYFKADAYNIHKIIDKMNNIDELSHGKATRKIALNELQKKLNESLKLIEK